MRVQSGRGVFAITALASSAILIGQSPARTASGYLAPPKVIADILDAPPIPQAWSARRGGRWRSSVSR